MRYTALLYRDAFNITERAAEPPGGDRRSGDHQCAKRRVDGGSQAKTYDTSFRESLSQRQSLDPIVVVVAFRRTRGTPNRQRMAYKPN